MKAALIFFKKEPVLCAAWALALASCFFVPPDAAYLMYFDGRVLALLFCLMAVMAGLKALNVFDVLARRLLGGAAQSRTLYRALVLLCFFSAMLITNDVALITFVPFTITLLMLGGLQRDLIAVIALETIAANLGSMLTPIGNPQNLYLYSLSGMNAGAFVLLMLPPTLLSLGMLLLACQFFKKRPAAQAAGEAKAIGQRPLIVLYAGLFVLCLLCVARVADDRVILGATLLLLLAFDRKTMGRVDYALLLTFCGFFVFIGNLGRMEAVRGAVTGLLAGHEVAAGFWFSQVISNVPAAILLSGFTTAYEKLIIGVNIGGLGTLIASLASLISYKFYAASPKSEKGRYLLVFTGLNILFAAALLLQQG